MSDRVTLEDVRIMWSLYLDECIKHGFSTEGWTLQEGSIVNGRAFRCFRKDGQGAPGTFYAGFLGSTRKEACAALEHMHRLMFDLRHKESE